MANGESYTVEPAVGTAGGRDKRDLGAQEEESATTVHYTQFSGATHAVAKVNPDQLREYEMDEGE